ncbi:helix-turn-helix domain-containing protein [Shinella sp. M27]|uniref:helix-turn-helix domain-containing protein n=1 Tax=Shinella sp. M27 TaxID=3368614 RepID=UPI003BA18395
MISAKEIGANVKELRRVKNMTQADLADAIGRTTDAISQIERGVNVPSLETLLSLSRGLAVPIETMLGIDSLVDGSRERRALVRQGTALLSSLSDEKLGLAIGLLEVVSTKPIGVSVEGGSQ